VNRRNHRNTPRKNTIQPHVTLALSICHGRHATRPSPCIVHPESGKGKTRSGITMIPSLTHCQSTDELAYHLTAHLRMNGIYWGLTALCIMGHPDALDREQTIAFVMSCWDDEAGTVFVPPLSPYSCCR